MLAHHVAPMREGETLAAYRELSLEERTARADGAWSARLVQPFPLSWAARLLDRWRERHALDTADANRDHLTRCTAIARAHRAGVQADANDAELCEVARQTARELARRVDLRERITDKAEREEGRAWPEGVRLLALWAEAVHWFEHRGLAREFGRLRGSLRAILARAKCERYWRRLLRTTHARAVEATARAIGLVHKRAGCYVSDESAKRRRGQIARNARALDSVTAINEHGQDYTLAELAARGPANKEIRRHELMTRIAGFELIARECGHAAYFVTVTCPSRMHAMRTKRDGYGVEPNPKHDGTAPDAAQQYLRRQWARCRAAMERAGLGLYGFRIAEPNHDGTPHWHALLFFPERTTRDREGYRVMVRALRRYFLWSEPGAPEQRGAEHGARRHRVKVERIDWGRGSAAGYVAKYVAKNIDGAHVGKDLFGNDAFESSQRVEAWAATWRVRQFQQIGGAPVGVWRELRRLHPEQESVSPGFALALDAVNITQRAESEIDPAHDIEQRETAAHGWATYLHLQGGHRVKRAAQRLRILREQSGELGRYGEPVPPRAVGVQTVEVREHRVPTMGWGGNRHVTQRAPQRVEVESERSQWQIVPRGSVPVFQAQREAVRTWSPVNNCTGPADPQPRTLFMRPALRVTKRGRWATWDRGRAPKESNAHPEPDRGRLEGPPQERRDGVRAPERDAGGRPAGRVH